MADKKSKKKNAVEKVMHKFKQGNLKSTKSKKTVKSRKQAIAIGLSEARQKGEKVPAPKKSSASASKKKSASASKKSSAAAIAKKKKAALAKKSKALALKKKKALALKKKKLLSVKKSKASVAKKRKAASAKKPVRKTVSSSRASSRSKAKKAA